MQYAIAESFQIAWDYLDATGELGNPDMAAGHLLDSIEMLVRRGERRPLLLSNKAIASYQRFRAEQAAGLLPTEQEVSKSVDLAGGSIMDNLTKRDQPDRSKINMHEDYEVKYWTKALGISREELQKAVDKVGSSAAAVRKELGLLGASHS